LNVVVVAFIADDKPLYVVVRRISAESGHPQNLAVELYDNEDVRKHTLPQSGTEKFLKRKQNVWFWKKNYTSNKIK
jgi:hypothetical protein